MFLCVFFLNNLFACGKANNNTCLTGGGSGHAGAEQPCGVYVAALDENAPDGEETDDGEDGVQDEIKALKKTMQHVQDRAAEVEEKHALLPSASSASSSSAATSGHAVKGSDEHEYAKYDAYRMPPLPNGCIDVCDDPNRDPPNIIGQLKPLPHEDGYSVAMQCRHGHGTKCSRRRTWSILNSNGLPVHSDRVLIKWLLAGKDCKDRVKHMEKVRE